MSGVAEKALNTIDPNTVVHERRRNYLYLSHALADVLGARLAFETLPEDVCPLCLPVVVPNRSRVVAVLRSLGINVGPWWAGFHTKFSWDGFPEAVCRMSRATRFRLTL